MKFQHKRIGLKVLIVTTFLGVLACTFLSIFSARESSLPSGKSKSSSKLAYAKGISFVEYHGEKKFCSVSVDSFSIERVRFGPFVIGPLRMAQLNKVTVDLYLDGTESELEKKREGGKGAEAGVMDLENSLSNIRNNLPLQAGRIRGLNIKDISINLWKNEDRIFRISSDTVTIDRNSGDLIFVGHAKMEVKGNGNLISHRIRWNKKTRLFRVRGPYLLTKKGKKIEGREIETDYLLTHISDQSSNSQRGDSLWTAGGAIN